MDRWFILAAALLSPAAAAILRLVEPTDEGWYPKCAFHWLTGLHCPMCGTTRCGHAMLNGDIAQAAAWNVLAVVLLPLATLWLYWAALCVLRKKPVPRLDPPTWMMKSFLVLLLVFWLVRNLPIYPFDLLAPHRL